MYEDCKMWILVDFSCYEESNFLIKGDMQRIIIEKNCTFFFESRNQIKDLQISTLQSAISAKILHVWRMDQGAWHRHHIAWNTSSWATWDWRPNMNIRWTQFQIQMQAKSKWKTQLLPKNINCKTGWHFRSERPHVSLSVNHHFKINGLAIQE